MHKPHNRRVLLAGTARAWGAGESELGSGAHRSACVLAQSSLKHKQLIYYACQGCLPRRSCQPLYAGQHGAGAPGAGLPHGMQAVHKTLCNLSSQHALTRMENPRPRSVCAPAPCSPPPAAHTPADARWSHAWLHAARLHLRPPVPGPHRPRMLMHLQRPVGRRHGPAVLRAAHGPKARQPAAQNAPVAKTRRRQPLAA